MVFRALPATTSAAEIDYRNKAEPARFALENAQQHSVSDTDRSENRQSNETG